MDPSEIHAWLANIPELRHRRAPGNTCLSAISRDEYGTVQEPINTSKGCGGVMRIAPIGLYFIGKGTPQEQVDMLGAEVAAMTHGHELGYLPAALAVHVISLLAGGEKSVERAVQDGIKTLEALFPPTESLKYLIDLIDDAVRLSKTAKNDLAAIQVLGEGWVAEETLAIAIYCALKYQDDFERALIASVNHGGDSDSTGAVTGNILGAYLGLRGIPEKFIKHLEIEDVIEEIATDLYNGRPDSETRDEIWESKYIRHTYRK